MKDKELEEAAQQYTDKRYPVMNEMNGSMYMAIIEAYKQGANDQKELTPYTKEDLKKAFNRGLQIGSCEENLNFENWHNKTYENT